MDIFKIIETNQVNMSNFRNLYINPLPVTFLKKEKKLTFLNKK